MRAAAVIAGSRRPGPGIEPPADIDPRDLAPEVRSQLRTLSKLAADGVARHLVAAGRLVDEDPRAALQHARAARALGSRVAVVREAVGETAYAAGEWAEAIAELRTARRMSGDDSALPMIADSERALGRADRALRLAQSDEARALGPAERAEMTIVEAGARRDLGQLDAALLTLQDSGLDQRTVEPWSARVWYAYADLLLAAGREDEARDWFVAAAGADQDGSTDADERLLELDGIEILDDDEDPVEGELDAESPSGADGDLAAESVVEADDTADGDVEDEFAAGAGYAVEADGAADDDVEDDDDEVVVAAAGDGEDEDDAKSAVEANGAADGDGDGDVEDEDDAGSAVETDGTADGDVVVVDADDEVVADGPGALDAAGTDVAAVVAEDEDDDDGDLDDELAPALDGGSVEDPDDAPADGGAAPVEVAAAEQDGPAGEVGRPGAEPETGPAALTFSDRRD